MCTGIKTKKYKFLTCAFLSEDRHPCKVSLLKQYLRHTQYFQEMKALQGIVKKRGIEV